MGGIVLPVKTCVLGNLLVFQDIIYKVKTAFNSEFDAAYKQKEFELARVKEKNVRIKEIISYLDLGENVWQPEFEDCEKPERTLIVENSEVLTSLVSSSLFLRDFPRLSLYRGDNSIVSDTAHSDTGYRNR